MKKTFPLQVPGKQQMRVVEAIKQDVRKYLKRERRKPLTEGIDFWDFDCKVGVAGTDPAAKHVAEVIPAIDAVAATEGASGVYVEILAKPGHRTAKPVLTATPVDQPAPLEPDLRAAEPDGRQTPNPW